MIRTTSGLGTACHPAHGKPLYDVMITSSHVCVYLFIFVTSFVYSFVPVTNKHYVVLTIALFLRACLLFFLLLLLICIKDFMLHYTHLYTIHTCLIPKPSSNGSGWSGTKDQNLSMITLTSLVVHCVCANHF